MTYPVQIALFPPSVSLRRVSQHWYESADCDQQALALHLRHYPRKSRKDRLSSSFVGSGQKIVLLSANGDALFTWIRNTVERMDKQRGVICTSFRNESDIESSVLIREAVYIAWNRWPRTRLFTYVDGSKIRSCNPGYSYKQAGWNLCGTSKSGLTILEFNYA